MKKPIIIPSKTNNKNMERYLHKKLSEIGEGGQGKGDGSGGKSPYIGENGHWFEWNVEQQEFVDTGISAQGPQGEQGNTGSSIAYPFELVNNRTTNDPEKGLSAAEGKRLGDDISDLNQDINNIERAITDKADINGYYDGMAVGSANTLAGQDTKVEDFFFKPIDFADGLAKLNSARGKSLVWNQAVQNGDFANGTTGWTTRTSTTLSATNGIATITISASGLEVIGGIQFAPLQTAPHKVLCSYKARVVSGSADTRFRLLLKSSQAETTRQTLTSSFVTYREIMTLIVGSGTTNESYLLVIASSNAVVELTDVCIFDLTLMFGAGNEPATVGEFEAMFPLPYYDYNPGEIISNKTEGVKVAGFNQWDEEWVNGLIDAQTGEVVPNTTNICSKNHIKVLPNTDYYAVSKAQISNGNFRIRFYDAAKQYLGTDATFSGNNLSFRTPSNAIYMLFYMFLQYGNTYRNDICINLSDPARNGTYEPYKTNTIELNLPTLTGKLNGEGESVVVFPDGLKSAGSVYDEIVGNKAIKRVGSVDLNTLSWQAGGSSNQLWAAFLGNNPDHALSTNGIAEKYMVVNQLANTLDVDNTISLTENATRVYVYPHSASEPTGILYYELATPEEYVLDALLPDTFQAYKGGTIKQLPENTSVPTTAPMVMTVTYAIDAVGTLVGLPRNYVSKESLQAMLNAMQSAGIIASYTMTYNENTGKYDFTFVAPTNS